jgi:hypothetical protein
MLSHGFFCKLRGGGHDLPEPWLIIGGELFFLEPDGDLPT